MLVLTRRRDEEVILIGIDGKEIGRVRVVDVRGERIRIGFEFPRSIAVHRTEVYESI